MHYHRQVKWNPPCRGRSHCLHQPISSRRNPEEQFKAFGISAFATSGYVCRQPHIYIFISRAEPCLTANHGAVFLLKTRGRNSSAGVSRGEIISFSFAGTLSDSKIHHLPVAEQR